MKTDAMRRPAQPVSTALPPDGVFDEPYWDYGLLLAWIVFRDPSRAQLYSEQTPRSLGNVLIETVEGAKAAKRELLQKLKTGQLHAVSADELSGTARPVEAYEWLPTRLFFDDVGVAYLAPAKAIVGRDSRLLRFVKSDAMNLWPPNPQPFAASPPKRGDRVP
jgi:hypothetical protein